MSKAILVIDMPESCRECDSYVIGSVVFCGINGEKIEQEVMNGNKKSEKCPLRNMPEKKKLGHFISCKEDMKVIGWNACIDAIEGSEKE